MDIYEIKEKIAGWEEEIESEFKKLSDCENEKEIRKKLAERYTNNLNTYSGIFFNDDCLMLYDSVNGNWRYYASLECVDEEYVCRFGDYVIYSADCDRIGKILDILNGEE